MGKFTEAKLEQAFIELLGNEGYPHFVGSSLVRTDESELLIEEDLKTYLLTRYQNANLTETEAQSIILQLKTLSSADLYESNKKIMQWLADGFILKWEDRNQKDIHISLIHYAGLDRQRQSENLDIIAAEPEFQYPPDTNIYKFVNQLELVGTERRIPDGILYVNGLPVVVFEFKTAILCNPVKLTGIYKQPYIELDYKCNEAPIKYRVQLVSVPSNLGKGVVWYLVCLRTGKCYRKLYLVDNYFYHRSAFRGCMFQKQTQSKKSRWLDKTLGVYFRSDQLFK